MKIAKTITLIRHGATIYNDRDLVQGWGDIPLSDKGRAQSLSLAKRLKEESFDIVFHTPLSRTIETAEIVNQFHQTPFHQIDSFREMNLGDWEGHKFTEMVRQHPEVYQQWATNVEIEIPGGESFVQLFHRVQEGVKEVMDSPYENILISGHAMANRAILGNLMKMPPMIARKFRMENCAFSRVLVYRLETVDNIVLDVWNDKSHLPVS